MSPAECIVSAIVKPRQLGGSGLLGLLHYGGKKSILSLESNYEHSIKSIRHANDYLNGRPFLNPEKNMNTLYIYSLQRGFCWPYCFEMRRIIVNRLFNFCPLGSYYSMDISF